MTPSLPICWSLLQKELKTLGVQSAAEMNRSEGLVFPTQILSIDSAFGGGLPREGLTEVVVPHSSFGGTLLLDQLIESTCAQGGYQALVDASDRFAPETVADVSLLRQLYWVRCRSTEEALRASDIIANDANFLLLVIDLRGGDERVLANMPKNRWYRLQRAIKKDGKTAVALTSFPCIPAATTRIQLKCTYSLDDLEEPTAELLKALEFEMCGRSSIANQHTQRFA